MKIKMTFQSSGLKKIIFTTCVVELKRFYKLKYKQTRKQGTFGNIETVNAAYANVTCLLITLSG